MRAAPPVSLCSPEASRLSALPHCMQVPHHDVLPDHKPRNHGAKQPRTETSDPQVKMSVSCKVTFLKYSVTGV